MEAGRWYEGAQPGQEFARSAGVHVEVALVDGSEDFTAVMRSAVGRDAGRKRTPPPPCENLTT